MDKSPLDSDTRDEFAEVEVEREWQDFDSQQAADLARVIDNTIILLALDLTKVLLPASGYPKEVKEAMLARIEFLIEKHKG